METDWCADTVKQTDIFAGGQTEKEMIDRPGRDSCAEQTGTAVPILLLQLIIIVIYIINITHQA